VLKKQAVGNKQKARGFTIWELRFTNKEPGRIDRYSAVLPMLAFWLNTSLFTGFANCGIFPKCLQIASLFKIFLPLRHKGKKGENGEKVQYISNPNVKAQMPNQCQKIK